MKTILCFGDSNTWGYNIESYDPVTGIVQRFPESVRWPGVLRRELGDGYAVIEDALNARTIMVDDPYADNRKGLPQLVTALDKHAPLDIVILHLGVNELKHHFSLSAEMIALGMESLVRAAQTPLYGYPAPKVLLIAPAPVPDGIATGMHGGFFGPDAAAKSRRLGALSEAVAQKCGCAFLDAGALGFRLNDTDFLHYCAEDHKKLGIAAAKAVRSIVG